MARLNEPPAPAPESIEALKRRFIRQNREIARVNSNQSVRIRNLEIEISRLLAENILLREEAINAKIESEKWKATQRLSREVSRMKEQLETKLSEVNALVQELGNLPEKVARRSSEKRRRSIQASNLTKRQSGEERDLRQRLTLSEQEGRLPAILEDKCYPRRTLEAIQINDLLNVSPNDALESPDLGPPPVAHFDEHEIVTFDAVRSPRRTSTELIEESERIGRIGMTSAENRRKRRTSALLQPTSFEAESIIDVETVTKPTIETAVSGSPRKNEQSTVRQPSRIGSKRKLEMSELEDTSQVSKELDDFIFQRKALATKAVPRPSRFSRPPGKQNQENTETSVPASPERSTVPIRTALAPKSTNSPTKRRVSSTFDKPPIQDVSDGIVQNEKHLSSRIRSRPTASAGEKLKMDSAPKTQNKTIQEPERENIPETPAADLCDIASPLSSGLPLSRRPTQEMAVTNSVEDVLNGSIGRGSRRARAAVSYAEPNLRDKMRRPGKALVGAVEGLAKTSVDTDKKSGPGVDPEVCDRKVDTEFEVANKTSIETSHLSRWQAEERPRVQKSEPVSPLGHRKTSRHRASDATSVAQEDKLPATMSSTTVFDGPESSPASDVQPASSSISLQAPAGSRQIGGAAQISGSKPGPSTLRSRRSEIMSKAQPMEAPSGTFARRVNLKKSTSVTALPNLNQLNACETSAKLLRGRADGASSPVETASGMVEPPSRTSPLTRRRSMMV